MKKKLWNKKYAALGLALVMSLTTLPIHALGAQSDTKTEEEEPEKEKQPLNVSGEITIKSETDKKARVSATIEAETVPKAVSKAESSLRKEETKLRKEFKRRYEDTEFVVGDINLIFAIAEGKSGMEELSIEIPKETWKALIESKARSVSFKVGKTGRMLTLSQEAVRELNQQAEERSYIEMRRVQKENLSTEAAMVIGERPAYQMYFRGVDGRVREVKKGTITVTLPYKLQGGELAEDVQGVMLNDDEMPVFAKEKWYDKETGLLTFQTTEFSVYAAYPLQPKEGVIDDTDLGTGFQDIINHKDKAAIAYVYENKLMSGVSDVAFAPNAPMTRGMLVTVLGRAAKINPASYKSAKFKDVPKKTYYAPYINWAVQSGIVSGTDAKLFSPDRAVSRQELAVILANYAKATGKPLQQSEGKIIFTDESSIAPWAKEKVIAVQRAGLMKPRLEGKFEPKAAATRGDVAVALYQYAK